MTRSKFRSGQVVTYSSNVQMTKIAHTVNGDAIKLPVKSHEGVTRARMAEKLAALKGFEYAGEYNQSTLYDTLYFVPSETLLLVEARQLGIRTEEHLFGGCVSEPFIGTKSITHPLFDSAAAAPAGWTMNFAAAVTDAVLKGYSVFSADDARRAATELLKTNRIRLKPALGIGGTGQTVIGHIDELEAPLEAISTEELARYGVVIEQDLEDVITYSVGALHVAGLQACYYGTQTLTDNHHGAKVYGGSTLHVVRGDFNMLQQLDLAPEIARAIAQACTYDRAANNHLPGFLASRRNYDVVQGVDLNGQSCAGVLEQSWRIGGASPAEIAALEAFVADPKLRSVQASTREIYGIDEPPAKANVHFRGIDPRVGAIAKYSLIESCEYSTDEA